jgi:hypothetical protein
MKTSTKSAPDLQYKFLIKIFFICLLVVAFSVAALPSRADKAEDDAKAALQAWKDAVKDVKDKKDKLTAAHEKVEIAAAKAAKSGKKQTPEQEQQLKDLRAEEAAAAAELEKAEAAREAARQALENALMALPDDSDLRKQLKKERDGFILDNPDARGPSTRQNNVSAQSQSNTPVTKTAGGLQVITFDTGSGRVTVNLPADMRAGDTISGTVIADPNGQTPEERAKDRTALRQHVVTITSLVDPKPLAQTPPLAIFDLSLGVPRSGESTIVSESFAAPKRLQVSVFLMPNENSASGPCMRSGPLTAINEGCSPISRLVIEGLRPQTGITADSNSPSPTFAIPILGQSGRPIAIPGPFDGNSSNTGVSFEPTVAEATPPDNYRGGWTDFTVLAESPRQTVITPPSNIIGPIRIRVKEGTTETIAPLRSVGVKLSAPKTNLRRGESTQLMVEVSGLQGIKEPVPLTLESQGVITMTGGNYQPLTIQPSQVAADGSYSTTRGVTGVQAGGWSATATVVTSPFNACFEPDNPVAPKLVRLNTFTGDYMFSCPGSAATQTSSGPITGKGTVEMKGCLLTLTHNAPDRRIHLTIDQCTKSGSATVEMPANAMKFTAAKMSFGDCDNVEPCF